MLELEQIAAFYPEPIRAFKKNILREYLQYKILDLVFESKYGGRFAFMGGTSIRIVCGSNRFSEDLDFDNLGISEPEFEELSDIIKRNLSLEGYVIEMRNVYKQAYHCHINILNVLYESGISSHRSEKLKVHLDCEPQGVSYQPDKIILNKFDVFTRITAVPERILLSQKIFAILNRKRTLGRDIFDAIFLFGRTAPDLDYLKLKAKISTQHELKRQLLKKCDALDFARLTKDLEPFLINPRDSKKILLFREFVSNLKL